jgi:isopentenyl-diphosphate delta-isomerase
MIKVVLVDKKDRMVGRREKYEAHRNPVPLHRAVSVLIFNDKGEMLLQKRASGKPTWPGFWSNTTCTHPLPGEGFRKAAERRLKEEMGFSVPLTKIGAFIYKAKYDSTWGEHEYDIVFKGEYSGRVKINKDEAEDYRWIRLDVLRKDLLKNPEKYTPWFKIILEKFEF